MKISKKVDKKSLSYYMDAAREGCFALGCYNFSNAETLRAICAGCQRTNSPAIVAVSEGALQHLGLDYVLALFSAAKKGCKVPLFLHLDHGHSFQVCKQAVDSGFDSVMIDASALPFAENVALTRKVVQYAHKKGVFVEAELGVLCGVEEETAHEKTIQEKIAHEKTMPAQENIKQNKFSAKEKVSAKENGEENGNFKEKIGGKEKFLAKEKTSAKENAQDLFTSPEAAAEFVQKTGCNSLAVAVGTSHGAYKFKGAAKIRFDILQQIQSAIPQTPLVLHGASSVPQNLVKQINQYGGALVGAKGTDEKLLQKCATQHHVCKINTDTDIRLCTMAALRKHFAKHPQNFDIRQPLADAMEQIEKLVAHKNEKVFNCANRA